MSTELSFVLTEDVQKDKETDMNSDEVHDEVELILNSTGSDIMELFASDPAYYLDIVSRYSKTRDGRDIYLPDLCNILITKNPSEYRIKFKLSDNSNWFEVGFSGGKFTEAEVHTAFARKVAYALDRPLDSHRSMLIDTLQPSTEQRAPVSEPVFISDPQSAPVQSAPVQAQGDQTKLSKIDRFMGRTGNGKTLVGSQKETQEPVCEDTKVNVKVNGNVNGEVGVDYDLAPREPKTRKPEVSKPGSALSELDMLRTICPADRQVSFEKLVNLLRSNDVFYQSLVETLPRLTSGQQCLVINFLQN